MEDGPQTNGKGKSVRHKSRAWPWEKVAIFPWDHKGSSETD